MFVKDDGNVGIGTTNPNYKLDVRGTIGNNTTTHHSDIRWKKQVKTLSNALEKVLGLRGVSFTWRLEDYPQMGFASGEHVGFIAQEVEKVQPNLVVTDRDGYKSVEYANMVALLVEAVKEQQKQFAEKDLEIAQLRDRLSMLQSLEKENAELCDRLTKLETLVAASSGL
jgi:hypothetical protein